jgi:putative membrane protein
MTRSFWNFEPTVILGTVLLMLGYTLAVGPLRHQISGSKPVTPLKQTAFYLGCVCMLLALVGPLDVLGDETLFSAHMTQHMILSFVAPPLWILGTPGWLMKSIFPSRILAILRNPWIAFIIFNGMMWIWHLPTLYDDALSTEWLHIGEHVLFMAAGVIGCPRVR